MPRDPDSRAPDEDYLRETKRTGFTCDVCGGTFERPLLATTIISDQTQKYYACPRCMAKTPEIPPPQKDRAFEAAPVPTTEPAKPSGKSENAAECAHFFGYLRKRQKNASIPEECLTCSQMVECIMQ